MVACCICWFCVVLYFHYSLQAILRVALLFGNGFVVVVVKDH